MVWLFLTAMACSTRLGADGRIFPAAMAWCCTIYVEGAHERIGCERGDHLGVDEVSPSGRPRTIDDDSMPNTELNLLGSFWA